MRPLATAAAALVLTSCVFAPAFIFAEAEKTKKETPLPPLDASRQTALVRAAEVAGPSVVCIGAERTALVRRGLALGQDPFDMFFNPAPTYQKMRQKTPYLGSGIAVDKEGHIVTNFHVVEGAERVFVTLHNGKEFEAELVDADAISDIAILKINAPGAIIPATLGDSDDVRLGEWAMAIGNPFGPQLGDPTPTITAGVISAKNRYFRSSDQTPRLYEGMIQTDAAINPGNSGGALCNAKGEVIGVNTFIFSESGGSVGIGFAIPINKVKHKLEEVRSYGKLRQARLDMEVIDITPYVQQSMELKSTQGALLYRMEKNGPAATAGLQPGDQIQKVNGRAVNTRRDCLVSLYGANVGEKIKIDLLRNNRPMQVEYEIQAAKK